METLISLPHEPNILQQEALVAIREAEKTKDKGTVVMPTGTGKTYCEALWFSEKLRQKPDAKLLFICHNTDILTQSSEQEFQKFKESFQDLNIKFGYYRANEKHIEQATFATTQTLTKNLHKFNPEDFDYVIIDEVHHYQAETYKKVAQYFKPKFLLGLTATPYRSDLKSIFEVCGDLIYTEKIERAIKLELLSKINYYYADHDIDFSQIKWNGKRYDEVDLNKKI
jgi:superfamily II DNA or RNA helicase